MAMEDFAYMMLLCYHKFLRPVDFVHEFHQIPCGTKLLLVLIFVVFSRFAKKSSREKNSRKNLFHCRNYTNIALNHVNGRLFRIETKKRNLKKHSGIKR